MPNLNKVLLMGNLTRDPELRVTPKGTSICQFGLAINRKFKSGDGAEQEEVLFVDLEAWGKTGETIAKYCSKGKPLYVEGRLKLDSWEDKNTREKRTKMKIVVEQFQFLGGKGEAQDEGSAIEQYERNKDRPTHAPAPTARQGMLPGTERPQRHADLDEDVPF